MCRKLCLSYLVFLCNTVSSIKKCNFWKLIEGAKKIFFQREEIAAAINKNRKNKSENFGGSAFFFMFVTNLIIFP